jgi:hypothetical protein
MEKFRLKVFENRALRISESKRKKATDRWRKLCTPPNVIRVIKSINIDCSKSLYIIDT